VRGKCQNRKKGRTQLVNSQTSNEVRSTANRKHGYKERRRRTRREYLEVKVASQVSIRLRKGQTPPITNKQPKEKPEARNQKEDPNILRENTLGRGRRKSRRKSVFKS